MRTRAGGAQRTASGWVAYIADLPVIRYLVVAVVAAAADFGTLYTLSEIAGVHYAPSAALAFGVGLMVNFLLARKWVFGGTDLHPAAEFGGYAVIGVIGVLLTEAILYAGIDVLGFSLVVSKAAALAIVFAWNYLARKYIIYGKSAE